MLPPAAAAFIGFRLKLPLKFMLLLSAAADLIEFYYRQPLKS